MKKYILIIAILSTYLVRSQCTDADPCVELDITATTAYLGQNGSVKITWDDANNDDLITQPLIVAEGFDVGVIIAPENENGYQDCKIKRT